jgi:hypothetical protein
MCRARSIPLLDAISILVVIIVRIYAVEQFQNGRKSRRAIGFLVISQESGERKISKRNSSSSTIPVFSSE